MIRFDTFIFNYDTKSSIVFQLLITLAASSSRLTVEVLQIGDGQDF